MLDKPFHRNYRPVKAGINSGYSEWAYIKEKEYAQKPEYYTRAFFLIQKDILDLFQFIEPADKNLGTFSFKIHELLIRVCVEIESNFKAILKENIYNPTQKAKAKEERYWNIKDYYIINKTHHLDDYKIEFPIWKGNKGIRKPFNDWKTTDSLKWYQAYNKVKHGRANNFECANFENLIDAFAGLCALLTSQFYNYDFNPGPRYIEENGYCYYGGSFGIGGYLIVDLPDNWKEEEKYNFDWTKLEKEVVKFNKINYDEIIKNK